MKAVLLMLALAAPGDAVQQAKDLYRAGGEAYRQGQYAVAIDAFEAAKAITPAPPVVFSLAQAYRLQYFSDGDPTKLDRAISNYRAYIELAPQGRRRDHAARHIATLEPLLARRTEAADQLHEREEAPIARLIVSSPLPGATASVDDGEPIPIPAAVEVSAGPHEVRVEAPEHQPRTLRTVAVLGSVVPLNVELEEVPGRLSVRTDSRARITLDERAIGTGAVDGAPVPSGAHVLAVLASGRAPYVRRFEIGRGQAMVVDAQLEITGQRVAAYALFAAAGVVAAGAGAGLGLALDRESEASDLREASRMRALTPEEGARFEDLVGARDTFARVAWAGAGVAAAAGLLGAALYAFDEPGAPGAALMPAAAADGAGAVLRLGW